MGLRAATLRATGPRATGRSEGSVQTGLKISLGGHAAVIAAGLVGLPFASSPPPALPQSVEVMLVAPEDLPGAQTQAEVAATPQPEPAPSPPEAAEAEPAPVDPPPPPAPAPEPEVAAPAILAPEGTALPPPVDRVAPVPQPPAPEDAARADTRQEATAPTPEAEAADRPPEQATAPEAAAPQIVTEAVETDQTPDRLAGLRPAQRPTPPEELLTPRSPEAPQPAAPAAPEPEPAPAEDAIARALEQALAAPQAPQAPPEPVAPPAGPPLTAGEREGLRLAVGECWNFAALGSEAAQITVTVAMEMSLDGRPSALRLAGSSGGATAAVDRAYETARRAILRCAPYSLPPAKYDQWRQVEMTFNPERMRRK